CRRRPEALRSRAPPQRRWALSVEVDQGLLNLVAVVGDEVKGSLRLGELEMMRDHGIEIEPTAAEDLHGIGGAVVLPAHIDDRELLASQGVDVERYAIRLRDTDDGEGATRLE